MTDSSDPDLQRVIEDMAPDEAAWLDHDRQTERITKIEDDDGYTSVCWGERSNYCTGMTLDRKPDDAPEPQVGDLITIWPYGGWWPIRGKAFNNRVWYWREESREERQARDRLRKRIS
jgi:hypothetical protein